MATATSSKAAPAGPGSPESLPIDEALPALRHALAAGSAAVLQAPPGAGKTTRVPLALLGEPWLDGQRLILLQPRRVAARAAARRMAGQLGETVGETVGFRIRHDSAIGPRTRIEVVTEGILTRQLQRDPALPGVAAVLLDEFHERSLHADLGLALCLEAQGALRPELRLLVMSATLDGGPVAALLGGAPVVTSEGRRHPVETRYLAQTPPAERWARSVAGTVRRALAEQDGSVLVFLPGAREIRRVAALLAEDDPGAEIELVPLHGDLPAAEQDRVLRPAADGRRRVVLATAIAETSLTIEGIRAVVDGGLSRVPRFDPRSGMTRLDTVRVSRATADQRRGRAGRLGPGLCYRVWDEPTQARLEPFPAPEIAQADLAPMALELAQWGSPPDGLALLDPPPAGAYAQAVDLLRRLEAVDEAGRLTPHGAAMLDLPVHPRLAHMLLKARSLGLGSLACEVAALLEERDILRGGARDADLRGRLDLLAAARRRDARAPEVDATAVKRVLAAASQLERRLDVRPGQGDPARTGLLVAFAYPDRVAQRRPGGGARYLMANGRGAVFAEPEPLSAEPLLAVAEAAGDAAAARVFSAARLDPADLETHLAAGIRVVDRIEWDDRAEAVAARRERRFGALVLEDRALDTVPEERITTALLDGLRRRGLEALPWTAAAADLRDRVAFLGAVEGEEAGWPDLSEPALTATLEDWLAPRLAGMSRLEHLRRLDLAAILRERLPWDKRRTLDRLAPTHLTSPAGTRLPIRYAPDGAVVEVRLQEMLGQTETPRVAGGRVPVTLRLLSPAGRPLQVTRDLAGFWNGSYPAVRAEMRGRYPKHPWPEDPLAAPPTRGTKRRPG